MTKFSVLCLNKKDKEYIAKVQGFEDLYIVKPVKMDRISCGICQILWEFETRPSSRKIRNITNVSSICFIIRDKYQKFIPGLSLDISKLKMSLFVNRLLYVRSSKDK